MKEPTQPTYCEIECTRRVSVALTAGVSPERLVELLNTRHVRLIDDHLTDGYTNEVLGLRLRALNVTNNKLAEEQYPAPTFDALDPYDFHYNQI